MQQVLTMTTLNKILNIIFLIITILLLFALFSCNKDFFNQHIRYNPCDKKERYKEPYVKPNPILGM